VRQWSSRSARTTTRWEWRWERRRLSCLFLSSDTESDSDIVTLQWHFRLSLDKCISDIFMSKFLQRINNNRYGAFTPSSSSLSSSWLSWLLSWLLSPISSREDKQWTNWSTKMITLVEDYHCVSVLFLHLMVMWGVMMGGGVGHHCQAPALVYLVNPVLFRSPW